MSRTLAWRNSGRRCRTVRSMDGDTSAIRPSASPRSPRLVRSRWQRLLSDFTGPARRRVLDARLSAHQADGMVKPLAKLISMLTPKRRWAQFSLASMFVVVTVLCVWLSVVANRAHRQRDAVAAIEAVGGEV